MPRPTIGSFHFLFNTLVPKWDSSDSDILDFLLSFWATSIFVETPSPALQTVDSIAVWLSWHRNAKIDARSTSATQQLELHGVSTSRNAGQRHANTEAKWRLLKRMTAEAGSIQLIQPATRQTPNCYHCYHIANMSTNPHPQTLTRPCTTKQAGSTSRLRGQLELKPLLYASIQVLV